MEGLTVGRSVHYVDIEGVHLAATVSHVWDAKMGMINLGALRSNGEPFSRTSILYNVDCLRNTWHWPERV